MSNMETKRHIRVVIVDDHGLFREGIRLILSSEEGIALVGEAAPGRATRQRPRRLKEEKVPP
jgi:DNA-binding NarL/FixJ family response regulator